ncbi:MAG: putative metal transporter ATP-binding protein [Ilumatobacteraceae bacterium]|nr:putative metal transporter ATP-binding protein [Ilumatobacteraceae bacterium]
MSKPASTPGRVESIATHVRLDHVTCSYGKGAPALDDVSFAVRAGSFTGIVGPSGSGKTTALRLMLGQMVPGAGSVTRASGLRVGYVPQVETINWNFPVTVAEAVLMSNAGRRWPWSTRAEKGRLQDVLARLGIGDLAGRHIRQLSGGQQQRVFIARALFGSPDLLLMDEPTSGVDVRTRHEMLHLLSDLNDAGLTIVVTTHDLNGLAAHLPRLICLNVRVMGIGAPNDVLTPEILERTYGAPMEVLEHAGMPLVIEGRAMHRTIGRSS